MTSPPIDLESLCGRHFRYMDLIACGETFERLSEGWDAGAIPPEHLPQNPDTWRAIEHITQQILDPIWEQYGTLTLTYGFAPPALTRHIHGRIYPKVDQHAGSELNRRGNLICSRKGMAVDLIVPGVSSLDVARWVRDTLDFDRLYFYEVDRPFHVSAGPENNRSTTTMRRYGARRVPSRDLPPS